LNMTVEVGEDADDYTAEKKRSQSRSRSPRGDAACASDTGLQDTVSAVVEDKPQGESVVEPDASSSGANDEGYFDPPVGYVFHGTTSDYTKVDQKHLGVGVSSVVWSVADKNNQLIALKVVRKRERLQKLAEKEVATLQRLKELASKDDDGSLNVCMLRENFLHDGYLCLAFAKLQGSLRGSGKQPLEKVCVFSKQMLLALRFLHDSAGLVHCDVKPDNLLLRHDGLAVLLSDFGAARSWLELQELDELQPLFYRAPEIIIGAMRGPAIDLWSAGCTIFELATDEILFGACSTAREVLQKIMQLRGALSDRMREQGRLAQVYFSSKGFHPEIGNPVNPSTFKQKPMMTELAMHVDFGAAKGLTQQEQAQMQLRKLMGGITMAGAAKKQTGGAAKSSEAEVQLQLLSSLIECCLDTDPASRISAANAAKHDIFASLKLPPALDLEDAPKVSKAEPSLN
jgi:serine/threonine protein kinase